MDESLKLFLIGFAVSIIVTIILDQNDDDQEGFMQSFVTKGAQLWHLVFMLTVLTTIPFMVIEPLKKTIYEENLLAISIFGWLWNRFFIDGFTWNDSFFSSLT